MPEIELWSALVTAIDPGNPKAMPAILHSTIDLLESELAKARAALRDIQPNAGPVMTLGDQVTVGAMATYKKNLVRHAPDFYYGSKRLTPKDLGLTTSCVYQLPEADHVQEQAAVHPPPPTTNLLDLLSNSLILDHMAPYLSTTALLSLAATSKSLHSMIMKTPHVFRYLDLSRCRGAQLVDPQGQSDDSLMTEDEFYSAPLRSIFSKLERKSILHDVRTLILDGLPVPTDLVADIILSDRFNVTILSLRECRHLNERKLMQVLQYAVRPTRPKGSPTVKGIYLFSPRTLNSHLPNRAGYRDWWSSQIASSHHGDGFRARGSGNHHHHHHHHQQNPWYRPSGKLFKKSKFDLDGWAQTLQKCAGIISFDAVLCRGLRHNIDSFYPANRSGPVPEGPLLGPAIATVALGPRGCDSCHSAPEGPAVWEKSANEYFPLLTPVPLHSSTTTAAKKPALDEEPILNARCMDCLTDRWCHRCNKWFCASCLPNTEGNDSDAGDVHQQV